MFFLVCGLFVFQGIFVVSLTLSAEAMLSKAKQCYGLPDKLDNTYLSKNAQNKSICFEFFKNTHVSIYRTSHQFSLQMFQTHSKLTVKQRQ